MSKLTKEQINAQTLQWLKDYQDSIEKDTKMREWKYYCPSSNMWWYLVSYGMNPLYHLSS